MAAPHVSSDLSSLSLDEIARIAAADDLPPVDRWNPPSCGHSAIVIQADGSWYHEGRPIRRDGMVRLFSRILRREPDGSYVLVTPVEKLVVDVEDLPFVAVEVKNEEHRRDRRLAFRLNTGDVLIAGRAHPLRVMRGEKGPLPSLLVRPGLEARIARPVYYELASLAMEEGGDPVGLWSDGEFFSLDEPE